ncbi:helix-turn-helix domain-containing protein [Trinickia dinghuensis]|uniref:Helix-turn-helix domain-containing protein n=1 Tax=Trinickia dinghuensis TaxID=2291023 RepID=A0A3D8JZ01_9BURK|nr:helix-turn-helix domain-containing protein [Trinickia dinghuensis]RDU98239.1 helix-turn-helix domain-containing protein [Trinickia dinghuensis]
MDSLIAVAARALAAGDALGALNCVALRDDAHALALRGIAMAQLGDLPRARTLLRSAARAFGPKQPLARARCVVAEAEVALASRDLRAADPSFEAAWATLEACGDRLNAVHARCLEARRLLLMGRPDDAERALGKDPSGPLPAALRASRALLAAGIALRRLQATTARDALAIAAQAARESGIASLTAEVEHAALALAAPAARLIERGRSRNVTLEQVQALSSAKRLIVDACRYVVRESNVTISLASRPVLFALVCMLAEAWPEDVPRQTLIAKAFRAKLIDETHRARLRVEIGRLRALMKPIADVTATKGGFALMPASAHEVAVLGRLFDEKHAAVLALLADGESWSSSALAVASGASQRSVQRALDALASEDKVQAVGDGRARRWMTPPVVGFATTLLLPTPWSTE